MRGAGAAHVPPAHTVALSPMRLSHVAELQDEVDALRQALASLSVIDCARGMLIERYGWEPDRAFAELVRVSQVSHLTMHEVAAAVIDAPHDPQRRPEYVSLLGSIPGARPEPGATPPADARPARQIPTDAAEARVERW